MHSGYNLLLLDVKLIVIHMTKKGDFLRLFGKPRASGGPSRFALPDDGEGTDERGRYGKDLEIPQI
ncbi:MAG: hypothetical protein AAF471_06900, partial [Myxococcota bacterium]